MELFLRPPFARFLTLLLFLPPIRTPSPLFYLSRFSFHNLCLPFLAHSSFVIPELYLLLLSASFLLYFCPCFPPPVLSFLTES